MCGEKSLSACSQELSPGTSPRVWGKECHKSVNNPHFRNIPTCVGKSGKNPEYRTNQAEHPHVCGEKNPITRKQRTKLGTSPRVWGKAQNESKLAREVRNIPTCVGKSLVCTPKFRRFAEHPHVCGEKNLISCWTTQRPGTSPRVWGKGESLYFSISMIRNIPTCVGKS